MFEMRNTKPSSSILYLSLSNGLMAFGSGAILNKSMNLLGSHFGLALDSLLSYLVGAALALGIILYFNKRLLPMLLGCVGGAIAVLILLFLSTTNQFLLLVEGNKLIGYALFLLLCMKFCFVFVARVVRMDIAAANGRGITWIELASSVGYVAGLLIWQRYGDLHLREALIFGLVTFMASLRLDYMAIPFAKNISSENRNDLSTEKSVNFPLSKIGFISVVVLIFALTVGVQVESQFFSSISKNTDSFAFFMAGTMIAPLLCEWLNLKIQVRNDKIWNAVISGKKVTMSALSVVAIIFSFSLASVYLLTANELMHNFAILIAAVFYEIFALLIFNFLGKCGSGLVSKTLGFIAVGCTIIYFVTSLSGITVTGCVYILGACLFFTLISLLVILRKDPPDRRKAVNYSEVSSDVIQ